MPRSFRLTVPGMMQSAFGGKASPKKLASVLLPALLVAGSFSVGVLGCGGSQKKGTANAASGGQVDWGMGNLDRSRCKESGKQVVTADTNQDSKADVWKFYAAGSAGQALTCKQVDLNVDGKVDLVDHYGTDQKVEMSEFDLDFDGKFDQTVFYNTGKKLRLERDMDFNGKPDYVEFYENGKVVRIERDSNNDGRVDEWQYYENGKLDRIGYDTKGNGKADKFDRAPEETQAAEGGATPAAAPAGTEPASSTQPPTAP